MFWMLFYFEVIFFYFFDTLIELKIKQMLRENMVIKVDKLSSILKK